MVSNTQMMDNQRQHYIPGPPPPPPQQQQQQQQQQQGNLGHLPPPPPRPYPSQGGLPPPPPGPHPSTLPPGTVYGIPSGWQQSWGRPGMNQGLPPPPPLNHAQIQMQNMVYGRQAGQMGIPPPPPQQQYDKPLVSATFIPGGDSFGPGVGIPPFEDYSTYNPRYDGALSDHATSQSTDALNHEARSASASSNRVPLSLALRESSPVSPGPPTATMQNPQAPTSHPETNASASAGRQRAQSAAVGMSRDPASQWPLERVIEWLAANGFSSEWQETFRSLKLDGADFIDLGRGGRGNLGKMYQVIYPQLAKVTQTNNGGWDTSREREDAKRQQRQREEGKRLRRLIASIAEGDTGPISAGPGHRRRESGLVASASAEGNVENSPYLGGAQFTATLSAASEGESPGRQIPPSLQSGFGRTGSQNRSNTLPVHSKQVSNTSTPSDSRNPDSFGGQNRSEYTRSVLNGLGPRGRHSPGLSGDGSQGLGLRQVDSSPSASPGLTHAVPAPAASAPNLLAYRGDHSKTNSADSSLKNPGRPSTGNLVSAETGNSGRFYENRRDGQEMARNSPLEVHRTYSNDYAPGPGGKDHSKGFLSKFMHRGKRQDATHDDQALESPTSPASMRHMAPSLPFSSRSVNSSDSTLAQRPSSASAGLESDKFEAKPWKTGRSSRKFMFVTPDHWNYRLIDVTDIDSAFSLRSRINEELGISSADHVQVYITEPGLAEHDESLNDNSLIVAQNAAESSGIVKLYVHAGPPLPPSVSAVSGQPATQSNSTSGVNRDPYPNAPEFNTPEALQKAAVEWRRQTELKQRAYLEARQQRKDSSQQSSTIRGATVIDFDSPRLSPYEDKKMETLVPVRKPPTAPSESNTLTKVNSLRMKPGDRNRSSMDALKRISDPIVEELDRGRRRPNGVPSGVGGIGAALANVGKLAGAPATAGGQTRLNDSGTGTRSSPSKPENFSSQAIRNTERSPGSSEGRQSSRPGHPRNKSYGADLEFRETNVSFTASPNPQTMNDSDDDSDDGLFAIPLSNKSATKDTLQDLANKDQRPTLTVDTDQHPRKPRSVAFKSPGSASETSAGPVRSAEDSAGLTDRSALDRSFSDGSAGFSAASPSEKQRPESFVSDIWANRPAVENVVDHLDAFFPGVDLDRPYVEENGDNSTPTTANTDRSAQDPSLRDRLMFGAEPSPFDFSRDRNENDTLGSDESTLKESNKNKVVSFAQRQMTKSGGGLGRAKSIRQRAQKANEISRAPSVAARFQNNQQGGIMRRKSTKMFGANIVQIKPKPGNRISVLDTIPQEETPADGLAKRQATFKIIRGNLIGKGTYGRVYLGMNATTGEFLAVKQVEVNQKAAGQDKDRIKEMVAALDQEIDTMQHLEHPNIVQYLGCERKEFSISIYLEYIPGGSIGSCLRKHGKFEESVVRSLTQQTLNGLAYLHREGILHRDLKADNILLDLDGTSKISDFGISKKSDNIYGNDVTNSMQGSVFWMAPEVVRAQGQGYSAKVDIWSLGCVVLEMFAGKRPWSRDEAIGAIFKLGSLNQAPPIPDDVQATASVDGLNFMYDCFQVDPNDRPTAETLLRHSSFCVSDSYYNFYDTNLAAKLRTADAAPTGL